MFPNVVNRENVWMIEGRGGARFLLEAVQPVGVRRELSRENFDRHVTIESPVARAIDFAHAALAELGDNRVLGNGRVEGNRFTHIMEVTAENAAFSITPDNADRIAKGRAAVQS